MSYLACHIQKFKMTDVKGIQRHNQRESENSSNKDIDKDRSSLNYDLHNSEDINYNEKVKGIIDEQYTGQKAIRKDATVMVNTIVTSDREFFQNLSEGEVNRFFEESFNKLKDMYGEKNIVSASVHFDEATPHMHVSCVPITSDGRLSAKEMFDRKSLRALQEELPKHLQDKGFMIERGVSSEKKHIDTHDFKRDELKSRDKELQYKLEQYKKADYWKSDLDDIMKNSKEKGLINKKVELSKGDYEKLCEMAKQSIDFKVESSRLKGDNEHLEKINKNNSKSFDKDKKLYHEKYRDISLKNDELKNKEKKYKAMDQVIDKHNLGFEVKAQIQKNNIFEEIAKGLDQTSKAIEQQGKERVRER